MAMKIGAKRISNISENISFFGGWAKTYDAPLFQFWMKKFHIPVFNEINSFKPVKILDVGCGTGELLKSLKEKMPKNVDLYGVDISQEMLEVAAKKLSSDVTLKKGDVHKLPFRNNYFDYALSTEAFHHYYNQKKALLEMVRVTKNGGKVIVVDVNFFLGFVHKIFQWVEPGCVKVNSKQEMEELFKNAKLVDIQQKRSFIFSIITLGTKSRKT